jgi:hypothetical protein
MKAKTIINKDRAELLKQADELLVSIAETEGIINADIARMTKEIKEIEDRHAAWNAGMTSLLKDMEKQIKSLMKKNSGTLFEGEDRVDLKHGSLLFSIEERVKKAQGVLEKLKMNGFKDGIKVVESVDWDELEKWPDDKLALVGTKKKKTENYTWETKAPSSAKAMAGREAGGQRSEAGKMN